MRVPMRSAILSSILLCLSWRSANELALALPSFGVSAPDTVRPGRLLVEGEAGGGIAIALGIRARGVFIDGRDLEGVVDVEGMPMPIPEVLPLPGGLGVLNGDDGWVGDEREVEVKAPILVGLLVPKGLLEGLPGAGTRDSSCLAVMPTYFEARDPGVMIPVVVFVPGRTGVIASCAVGGRLLVVGSATPGVLRPADADGVTRPLLIEGVTRPLPKVCEGVFRPLDNAPEAEGVTLPDCENDGVARPLRVDATDDGLDIEP